VKSAPEKKAGKPNLFVGFSGVFKILFILDNKNGANQWFAPLVFLAGR
jgi:hypothetical protein